MARRPQRKKERRSGKAGRVGFAVLVAVAVLALAFVWLLRTQSDATVAENVVGTVLSPIQNAFSGVSIYIRDAINGVKDYFRMEEDLAVAQRELTDLKLQLVELQEAQIENERLKSLLDIRDRFETLDPVYARVIARDPSVWFGTFSINVGTRDGVGQNMAVVTGDGLVGRVYEVGVSYAKVLSVIDARSSVAGLIERTRDNGIMYGQTALDSGSSECRMLRLPPVNDVAPGDIVITSGMDQLFPKGIRIGEVTQVSRQQSDVSDRYVLVKPAVDFLHIEEVLVLRAVVETDSDQKLPELPTPTPRPTPTVTVTPAPTPDPNAVAPGIDEIWRYPEPDDLTEGGELIESPTPAPLPGEGDGVLPEDEWVE